MKTLIIGEIINNNLSSGTLEILSKATIYKKEKKDKNIKEYKGSTKLSN